MRRRLSFAVVGIALAVGFTTLSLRLPKLTPEAVAPQATPASAQSIFTTPVGLGDSEMRRYQITIPAGWLIEQQRSQAPWDEASARDGLAELYLRQTENLQESVVVRIAEECRVHPHQGLALAFDEISDHEHTHILLKQPWTTKHGVEGKAFKEFLPGGHLIGYKIVTPTYKIGYLDVHSAPENPKLLPPETLQTLARQLFSSLCLLTADGDEVKN